MVENLEHVESNVEESNANSDQYASVVGGKRRRKGTKTKGTKGTKGKRRKGKGTKKRGPSKWIMHVKAFCRKTGKTFPEALKDPMCRNSFKH